jgi:hypothetical protein
MHYGTSFITVYCKGFWDITIVSSGKFKMTGKFEMAL